jgi:hypothetical protein
MTYVNEDGRTEPPVAGDETATLLGALERQRSYLAWKCGGLDAAGLEAMVGASSITLGGLLKHLARVEDDYFSGKLLGRDPGLPWDAVDWDADPDWEWHSAAVRDVQVTIDALVGPEVMPIWRPVLGYRDTGEEDHLLHPCSWGPPFFFQEMDAPTMWVGPCIQPVA